MSNRFESQITVNGPVRLVTQAATPPTTTGAGQIYTKSDGQPGFVTPAGTALTIPSTADLASVANAKGASTVGVEDAGGLYTATNVETALAEVKAIADAAIGLQKRTVTVTHATLTDDVDGEAQTVNVGAVLPANAIILASEVTIATPFSGGGVSAVKMDLGGTDIDAIIKQLELVTDQPTETERQAAVGIKPQGTYSAQQLVATFTSDGGHDVEDLTAGSVTITVWFSVLA